MVGGSWWSAFAPSGLRRDGLRAGSPSRSSRFGVSSRERRLVAQIFTSWNPLTSWLGQVEHYRKAA
jgi:hypothetical protein